MQKSPVETQKPPRASFFAMKQQANPWEMDAIDNDLPPVTEMKHYYPAWDASRSSVRHGSDYLCSFMSCT